jgi:nucleoside 2-deoxyribosyltransferase
MLSVVTDAPIVSSHEAAGINERTHGRIYLAGPFTAHLTFPGGPDGDLNSGEVPPGGVIAPQSTWRQTLLATAKALEADGWQVFLPHRDVSRWGERDASPGTVARECLEAVVSSDAVVAVMGESFGTHVEVGAALAKGIPVVVVRSSAAAESFFAMAVAQSPWVGELLVPALAEMPRVVATVAFQDALKRAGTARLGDETPSPA